MFLRSESESEREQGLGERTRPFRISRTERTLLDDGCEGQPLPRTADQELDRGTPTAWPHSLQVGLSLLWALCEKRFK